MCVRVRERDVGREGERETGKQPPSRPLYPWAVPDKVSICAGSPGWV